MTNNVTLYQITTEFKQIEEALMESGGELTSEVELALKEVSGLLTLKTDSVVGWVNSQEDLIEAADRRIKELLTFKTRISRGVDSLNGYLLNCMDNLGEVEIKGQFNKVLIRKPVKVLEIFDEDQIPTDYLTQVKTIKISKPDIKKAIKNGEEVPGCRLVDGNRKVSFK